MIWITFLRSFFLFVGIWSVMGLIAFKVSRGKTSLDLRLLVSMFTTAAVDGLWLTAVLTTRRPEVACAIGFLWPAMFVAGLWAMGRGHNLFSIYAATSVFAAVVSFGG